MAGLGNLFDGTGGTALDSYNGGVNTALDQQKQLLANQNSAAMNPLNAQFRQGEIARQGAELPGIVGQSQQQGAAGEIAQATKLDMLKQKQQELASKASDEELKHGRQFGERMMQLSHYLDKVPPPARMAVLVEQAGKMGINKDNPQLQALLNTPPDGLPKILYETGKGVAESSAEYLQKNSIENVKGGFDIERAKIAAEASKYAADRRVEIGEIGAASRGGNLSPEKRLVQILSVPEDQRPAGWQKEVGDLSALINLSGQARVPGTTADVLGGRNPQSNDERVANFNSAVGANKPAAPAPQNIEQAVKQAGGSYEPDKYYYRVGPDGKVQRAPKK